MEVKGVDADMLKEYLEKTYGYNEPILISEIKLESLNDNALRQYFKRMVKSGDLVRFDTGVYYLPKASRLLKKTYLDPLKVLTRKYIENGTDTYGYFSGAYFSNQLGLTTQMPAVIEIVTDKEATKGRTVTVGGQNVRLRRPIMQITKENVLLLQFLDTVSTAEKYAELPQQEMTALLKQYLRKNSFTQKQLAEVMPSVTAQAAKKLIEWGLIYEFTS